MPVTVPPAVNYSNPLIAVPTVWNRDPPEGGKMISVEIDWQDNGGKPVNINLQNNATLNFSQIVALSVDNSECGGDIRFVFPDTGETVTIPAYSPKVIVPVFTNQTQFFVENENFSDLDQTSFSIHNEMPPPIAVPTSRANELVSVQGIPVDGATTHTLIPAGTRGILQSLTVKAVGIASAAGTTDYVIKNSALTSIYGDLITVDNAATYNLLVTDAPNLSIPFDNGLTFAQSGSNVTGGPNSLQWLVYLQWKPL